MEEIRAEARLYIHDIKKFFRKMKRTIWNKWIRRWWCGLWIRGDEFHYSLSIDVDAMSVMSDEEQEKYGEDLIRRRVIADRRDI